MPSNGVALCVFATGKYIEFFPALAASVRDHFQPGMPVSIVLFTDAEHVDSLPADVVVRIQHLRWPYGTLYRYQWILESSGLLSTYKYILMCDVDMRFVSTVGKEVLGRRVAVLHAGHIGKAIPKLPYVRNPKSTAFVLPGGGKSYYAGGIQGGEARQYLKDCSRLVKRIRQDDENHVMADWHDESHWNAYLVAKPPTVELSPAYCWGEPDGCPPGTKILALDKTHALYRADGVDPSVVRSPQLPQELPPEPVAVVADDDEEVSVPSSPPPNSREEMKRLVADLKKARLKDPSARS